MASKGKRRAWGWRKKSLLVLAVILIAGAIFNYFRAIPPLTPTNQVKTPSSTISSLQWPYIGSSQVAVGAQGYGLLASDGPQIEQPTASTAKLITALLVLKKYPLKIGQTTTPVITLGSNDLALYQSYLAEDGSVAKVAIGEQISEYQALQAMLLPSANNIADSLAIWAYGSLQQYSTAANNDLASLGLKHTVVGADASGYLPSTVSTASDLTILGLDAMQNPVIAQIVGQKQAVIPVAGTVSNVNQLLGQNNVIGIKTGNSDQAGGVYIFAVNDEVNKVSPRHNVIIVGTVEGAADLGESFTLGQQIIDFAQSTFSQSTLVDANQEVGYYKIPWQKNNVEAIAQTQLTSINWSTNYPKPTVDLNSLHGAYQAGADVGNISQWRTNTNYDNARVVLTRSISAAPWWWRILRFRF
jgi:serine-type D-Ala-D-Ala carboxypeptidase (penicillin-binding protein 5/6)